MAIKSPFIGLVGLGYWGQNWCRELSKSGYLHSISDINDILLKETSLKYNVNGFKNFEDLLNVKEITAIIIALPTELHYEYARKIIEAGKDVLIEKPITNNLEEAIELKKLADKKNVIIMCGHILQFHFILNKMYDLIQKDYIGKIKYIVSNRFNLGKFRSIKNVLYDFAPHDISIILKLLGMPNSITCHGKDIIKSGVSDITTTIMEYPETYVQINVNWLNPFKEQKMTIVGEKGMFIFDDTLPDINNKLVYFSEYITWNKGVFRETDLKEIKKENIQFTSAENISPLENELNHFIKCCLERTAPITNIDEGINVMRILEYSIQSLNNNNNKIAISTIKSSPQQSNQYFKHETAVVDDGAIIGNGTKIWHFSHIMGNSEIGENCNIGQNVFIANDVKIGKGCKIQNNVSLYKGLVAGDYVFFGPSCVFTNDKYPSCRNPISQDEYLKTIIEDDVSIGANATILCGIKIGKSALIGAGAVVVKDVEDGEIIVGNPARNINKKLK